MTTTGLTLREGLALAATIDAHDGTQSPVIRVQQRVRLHWPAPRRPWSIWDLPCQHCGQRTHVIGPEGLPTHPNCAETALAAEITRSIR